MSHVLVTDHLMGPGPSGCPAMPRMPPIAETVAQSAVGLSRQAVPYRSFLTKTHTHTHTAMVSDADALSHSHSAPAGMSMSQTTGQRQVSSYHWISTRKWDW